MKKFTSRSVLLLILVVLTFSLVFSGCGNSGDKQGETSASTQAAASETPAPTPSGPVTLKILTADRWQAEYTLAGGREYPLIKELEKRTNTKIEWEVAAPANFDQLSDTRMASGTDLPDIAFLSWNTNPSKALNLAKQGLIIPLDELIEKYAPNIKRVYTELVPEAKAQTLDSEGKWYWLSWVNKSDTTFYSTLMRQDWMDKTGISKLPETTDEFYSALKTMRDKDANGNGKKDEIYLANSWADSINILGEAFGVPSGSTDFTEKIFADANGKLINGWLTENGKEFLMYMNKLYKDGLIDPEIATIQYEKAMARVSQNVASAYNNFAFGAPALEGTVKGAEGVNYVPLTKMAGPKGIYSAFQFGAGVDAGSRFVITRDCKNQEAAIKFLDYLYSDDCKKLRINGIEGVHYTMENGEVKKTKEYEDKIAADANAPYAEGFGWTFVPDFTIMTFDDLVKIVPAYNNPETIDAVHKIAAGPRNVELKFAVPTEEELSELDAIGNEAKSYMDEMIIKFFMGKESFDKWDEFVKRANELGMQKTLEVRQKMYDRYLGFIK